MSFIKTTKVNRIEINKISISDITNNFQTDLDLNDKNNEIIIEKEEVLPQKEAE